MSTVTELKPPNPIAAAVKSIERGVFPGDRARSDKLLFDLRNQADLAVTARNATTSTVMAIQAAVNALEIDGVPCFTSASVTSALYRAREANMLAQDALEHIRRMVRARFLAIEVPIPPQYHENDCLCPVCQPIVTSDEPTEHGGA